MSKRKRLNGPAAAERRRQIEERKEARKKERSSRIELRENNWIARYETNMQGCLNDERYRLPGGKRLEP